MKVEKEIDIKVEKEMKEEKGRRRGRKKDENAVILHNRIRALW